MDKTIAMNTNLQSANILVVDDEETNAILLERILTTSGYSNVISTQDPHQVAKLYRQHHSDLILLDINMPHMNGYEVMTQLKAMTDGELPPILVLTAQQQQHFRQQALDCGARDYVTKPFDLKELLSRVRNLLEVQLAHKFMLHQNEILDQRIHERTQELQKAQQQLLASRLQIVRRLGRAAEYRDDETGQHIIRMSQISVLFAKAIGMNEDECDLLLNAAPMHDIGKIGIPDNILLKPGKLTPDEWEIMKTHAQIGAGILSGDDSDLLVIAHSIALTHHEKWDGSGYPNGLSGEGIPMVGRITAIADVFDALTSERPYKKPWPIDKAVAHMESESGKHFDPGLMQYFSMLLPEIQIITKRHAEPANNLLADISALPPRVSCAAAI
ncbi:Response regulator [hydrothermal vent metagenome]|uniref:Response regulator n=1 Tax=hydrothermal vent metagenome TaxID=652676 RepID=A0A3B1BH54_9ZZZZ